MDQFERRPDPTPEEIEEMCREIRKGWPKLKKGKSSFSKTNGCRIYRFGYSKGGGWYGEVMGEAFQ